MSTQSSTIVQRVWNYCNTLRDYGISCGDYTEQRLSVVRAGRLMHVSPSGGPVLKFEFERRLGWKKQKCH